VVDRWALVVVTQVRRVSPSPTRAQVKKKAPDDQVRGLDRRGKLNQDFFLESDH
jgi:hypothetical protein